MSAPSETKAAPTCILMPSIANAPRNTSAAGANESQVVRGSSRSNSSMFLSSFLWAQAVSYLLELVRKGDIVAVGVARQYDLHRAVTLVGDLRPDPLVRKEKYKDKRPHQSKAAEIPGDYRCVIRVVFDREHMGKGRLFIIRQSPFITGLWSTDGDIVGEL